MQAMGVDGSGSGDASGELLGMLLQKGNGEIIGNVVKIEYSIGKFGIVK